ncbi:hypothetical protein AB1Y20_018471 [Prymnesium parvum]|uniref:Uncharacterized protein n=1 Tax=Prymnesium parvum TaxID=97485 RepID=A0AB34JPC7_PRYPA
MDEEAALKAVHDALRPQTFQVLHSSQWDSLRETLGLLVRHAAAEGAARASLAARLEALEAAARDDGMAAAVSAAGVRVEKVERAARQLDERHDGMAEALAALAERVARAEEGAEARWREAAARAEEDRAAAAGAAAEAAAAAAEAAARGEEAAGAAARGEEAAAAALREAKAAVAAVVAHRVVPLEQRAHEAEAKGAGLAAAVEAVRQEVAHPPAGSAVAELRKRLHTLEEVKKMWTPAPSVAGVAAEETTKEAIEGAGELGVLGLGKRVADTEWLVDVRGLFSAYQGLKARVEDIEELPGAPHALHANADAPAAASGEETPRDGAEEEEAPATRRSAALSRAASRAQLAGANEARKEKAKEQVVEAAERVELADAVERLHGAISEMRERINALEDRASLGGAEVPLHAAIEKAAKPIARAVEKKADLDELIRATARALADLATETRHLFSQLQGARLPSAPSERLADAPRVSSAARQRLSLPLPPAGGEAAEKDARGPPVASQEHAALAAEAKLASHEARSDALAVQADEIVAHQAAAAKFVSDELRSLRSGAARVAQRLDATSFAAAAAEAARRESRAPLELLALALCLVIEGRRWGGAAPPLAVEEELPAEQSAGGALRALEARRSEASLAGGAAMARLARLVFEAGVREKADAPPPPGVPPPARGAAVDAAAEGRAEAEEREGAEERRAEKEAERGGKGWRASPPRGGVAAVGAPPARVEALELRLAALERAERAAAHANTRDVWGKLWAAVHRLQYRLRVVEKAAGCADEGAVPLSRALVDNFKSYAMAGEASEGVLKHMPPARPSTAGQRASVAGILSAAPQRRAGSAGATRPRALPFARSQPEFRPYVSSLGEHYAKQPTFHLAGAD